jgi:hypothetical protein
MTAFQKAEALAGQRYDREKLLAVVDESHNAFPHAEQLREVEDAGSLSVLSRRT